MPRKSKTPVEKSPLERMADLTRKLISVKKTELPKSKPKKGKKH